MFFRADENSLKTPHMTGIFDKIIFRAITIIGVSLKLLEGENRVRIRHIILPCEPGNSSCCFDIGLYEAAAVCIN